MMAVAQSSCSGGGALGVQAVLALDLVQFINLLFEILLLLLGGFLDRDCVDEGLVRPWAVHALFLDGHRVQRLADEVIVSVGIRKRVAEPDVLVRLLLAKDELANLLAPLRAVLVLNINQNVRLLGERSLCLLSVHLFVAVDHLEVRGVVVLLHALRVEDFVSVLDGVAVVPQLLMLLPQVAFEGASMDLSGGRHLLLLASITARSWLLSVAALASALRSAGYAPTLQV